MRGMKVTVDAAMRARDVSRPRAEDEAMARASQGAAPGQADEDPAGPVPSDSRAPAATTAGPADAPGRASKPGPGRRRRRRR
jgi:hypothetical protein